MRRRGPKRYAVLAAAVVLIIAAVVVLPRLGDLIRADFAQKDAPKGPRLFRALAVAGARVIETDVAVWVDAGERLAAVSELRGLVTEAGRAAGLTLDWNRSQIDQEPFPSVVVTANRDGVEYYLGAQAGYALAGSRRARTVLSIKARYQGFNADLAELESELGNAALKASRTAKNRLRTFVTLTASLPDGTGRRDADLIARKVVNTLGGGKTQLTEGSNWASITAFAPGLGEPVRFAKHSMNLNVAWHEDGNANRFFLVAGTPLITEDY